MIDTTESLQYKANLFKFCSALLGKAVHLKTVKITKTVANKLSVPSIAQRATMSGMYKSSN
jgi:hypothetical protein